MFENPRREREERNFGKNVPKILHLKSSSEQIFSFRKLSLGAPDKNRRRTRVELSSSVLLQTLGKFKSLQGTERPVVVVICLLGSF